MTLFPYTSLLFTDRNDEIATLDLGGSFLLALLLAGEPSHRLTHFTDASLLLTDRNGEIATFDLGGSL